MLFRKKHLFPLKCMLYKVRGGQYAGGDRPSCFHFWIAVSNLCNTSKNLDSLNEQKDLSTLLNEKIVKRYMMHLWWSGKHWREFKKVIALFDCGTSLLSLFTKQSSMDHLEKNNLKATTLNILCWNTWSQEWEFLGEYVEYIGFSLPSLKNILTDKFLLLILK